VIELNQDDPYNALAEHQASSNLSRFVFSGLTSGESSVKYIDRECDDLVCVMASSDRYKTVLTKVSLYKLEAMKSRWGNPQMRPS
jgi:hypothetical protein